MKFPALVMGLIALILPGVTLGSPEIASIAKMTGLVRVSHAPSVSDWVDAKPLMGLQEKDRIKTMDGSHDRAEIKFKDGSSIRLGSRTTFEITTYEEDRRGRLKKIASRLFGGMLRAVVNKLEPDQKFEIYSTHAVASVKGTDFIFDGSTVTVIDEKDGIRHAVVMSDPTGGHIVEVLAGMMGGLHEDGTPINPTAIDPAVLNAILSGLEVSNAGGSGSGTGGNDGKGDGSGSGGNSGGGDDGEMTIDPESLRSDLTDLADSSNLSDIADNRERFTDVVTGRVLIDMNGYRVRAEQYVVRPDPTAVEFIAMNQRDGGPNAGLTIMDKSMFFNTALPDNFQDVLRGLPAAFANPNKVPDYFLLSDSFVVMNPAGDMLVKLNTFSAPQAVMSSHTLDLSQGYIKDVGVFAGAAGYDLAMFTWNYDESSGTQVGWGQQADKMVFLGTSGGSFIPKEHFQIDRYGRVEKGWYAGCNPVNDSGDWDTTLSNYAFDASLVWAEMFPVSIYGSLNTGLYTDTQIDSITPMFGNSNFGTGSLNVYTDSLGGTVKETLYGDGTFLRERQYAVNKDGQVLDISQLNQVATGIEDLNEWDGAELFMESVYEASEWIDPATSLPANIDIIFGPIKDYLPIDVIPDIQEPPPPPPPVVPPA